MQINNKDTRCVVKTSRCTPESRRSCHPKTERTYRDVDKVDNWPDWKRRAALSNYRFSE